MNLTEQIKNIIKPSETALTVSEVYALLPEGTNYDHVRGTVSAMAKRGQLVIAKDKRHSEVSGRLSRAYAFGKSKRRKSYRTKQKTADNNGPTEAGWKARLHAAQEEIASLRMWKEDAIQRYPDLAVTSSVIEARKAVADEFRNTGDCKMAQEILDGRHDKSMPMRMALRYIET